jgi:pyruvate,water dikinase
MLGRGASLILKQSPTGFALAPRLVLLALALAGATLAAQVHAEDQAFSAVSPSTLEAGAFYSGASVHLHGLVHQDSDVLVLLVGSTEPEVFNRRARVWIIWGGVEHVTFEGAPSAYLLLASGALPAIADPQTREAYRLGLPTLTKTIRIHPERPDMEVLLRDFFRLKQREGLYRVEPGGVELSDVRQGRRDFDADLRLPATMPPGEMELEVFELSHGHVVNRDVHRVKLARVGMPALLSALALRLPTLFGLVSVVLMLLTGLLISQLRPRRGDGEATLAAVIGKATALRVLGALRMHIGQAGEQQVRRMRAKYRHFETLLNLNNEVLGLLSELEEESSWTSFRHARVRMAIRALLDGTMDMVVTLNRLADDRYFDLETVVSSIRKEVSAFLDTPPPEESRLTISLGEVRASDEKHVGGKALNLARIECDLHLEVPRSFVVTTRAYRELLESTGLADRLRAILVPARLDDLDDLGSRSRQAIACIEETPIPPAVERAICVAARELSLAPDAGLAVRSSAVGEDSMLSFAGQFESLLNVRPEGLGAAWKAVVASRYLPRAIFYRRAAGIAEIDVPMAVLVQEMVEPLASGVLYTRRPDRPKDSVMLISSAWGVGRDVSGGSAESDQWIVSRRAPPTVLERQVAPKASRLTAHPGGGVEPVPLAESERLEPSLSDEQLNALTDAALAIDGYFGGPQDVEWAFDTRGGVVILQARPLRTAQVKVSGARVPDDAVVLLEGGQPVWVGRAVGQAWLVASPDTLDAVPRGSVLVLPRPLPDAIRVLPRVCGVVVERGSVTSHMASILREFRIPSLFGFEGVMSRLEPGRTVSLDVSERKILDGVIWPELRGQTPFRPGAGTSGLPEALAERLTTLSGGMLMATWACRSLHDVVRFAHEMAIQSMFDISDDLSRARLGGVKLLDAAQSFPVRLIDLGGGLRPGLENTRKVSLAQIVSVPFRPLWRGLTDERFDVEFYRDGEHASLTSVVGTTAFTGAEGRELGAPSYACLTSSYMNLNSRQAYHFAIVDAWVSDNLDSNHLSFRLKGGGAASWQRVQRVQFVGEVLRMHHFTVSERGDLLNAWQRGLDIATSEKTLVTLGRLLRFCNRLDMLMTRPDSAAHFIEAFLRAEETEQRSAPVS